MRSDVLLARWSSLWSAPDAASARIGREGELFATEVRLWLAAVFFLFPLRFLGRSPIEARVSFVAAVATGLVGIVVWRIARRPVPPPGLGAFTCILDVSLVSLVHLGLVFGGQPAAAVSGRVSFGAYFLALGLTCLRQDLRWCLLAGLTAVVEYAALVGWLMLRPGGVASLSSPIYGVFLWEVQVLRLALLAMATAISVAIVHQGRRYLQELSRLVAERTAELQREKARAEEAARQADLARVRRHQAGADFEQGRFTRTIPPDNTEDFAFFQVKRDIFQCPDKILVHAPVRFTHHRLRQTNRRRDRIHDHVAQHVIAELRLRRADLVLLADILYADCCCHYASKCHCEERSCSSRRSNPMIVS